MKNRTKSVRQIGFVWVLIVSIAIVMAGDVSTSIAQEMKANGTAASPAVATVTINVDAVEMVQVLNAFSQQSGQSIVVAPEVKGLVTARLKNIPWPEALDVILEPYGYSYQQTGSTVMIMPKKNGPSLEGLKTEVYTLKFLDVSDIKPIIEACLSPIGKISILGTQAELGWDFSSGGSSGGGRSGSQSGASNADKRKRGGREQERVEFSKILVVTDIDKSLEKIRNMIAQLDTLPPQILIEARFVEVSVGALLDLGVEFGTGVGGASGALQTDLRAKGDEIYGMGVQNASGAATPFAFKPKGANVSGANPFNTGLSLAFEKLTGSEFEILLHALEEKAKAKTLSVPSILTVNNQEASIIVGTKFPIIQSQTSGQDSTTSTSLEYYENIGIQLNVVPQVCGEGHIRMLIHPAVTDQTGTASAKTSSAGGAIEAIPLTEYPILSTREADTQVIMKSGDTIVIGGLMADRETKSQFKVPILGSIPFLGFLFRRDTTNNEKVELVIFITATVRTPRESAQQAKDIERMRPDTKRPDPSDKDSVKKDAPVAPVAALKEDPKDNKLAEATKPKQ